MQNDCARHTYQRNDHYKRQVQLFTTQLEEQQDSAKDQNGRGKERNPNTGSDKIIK